MYVSVSACVCVTMREREKERGRKSERERERERDREREMERAHRTGVETGTDLLHQGLALIMGGAISGGGRSLRLWHTKILHIISYMYTIVNELT